MYKALQIWAPQCGNTTPPLGACPPKISPSKKAFEKYKPQGLFSEFYSIIFLVALINKLQQLSYKSTSNITPHNPLRTPQPTPKIYTSALLMHS